MHANLEALSAVLAAAAPFDRIWCLGDLVGYGPNPNECVDALRRHTLVAVAGNHDWVACGKRSAAGFNPHAADAARWTAARLTASTREFLHALPETRQEGEFLLAHGSPRAPTQEYLFQPAEARRSFLHFSTRYCLVGHTHLPSAFLAAEHGPNVEVLRIVPQPEEALPLDGRMRMIINPGSVGQPRDGNPDAAFGIYDSSSREFQPRRVAYDVAATQQKMRAAKVPQPLSDRLAYGI